MLIIDCNKDSGIGSCVGSGLCLSKNSMTWAGIENGMFSIGTPVPTGTGSVMGNGKALGRACAIWSSGIGTFTRGR